jgi:hypothetical protein
MPPSPPHSLRGFTKEYCTRETIRGGWLKCVLDMELGGGNGIGLHAGVQAAALNE